MAHTLNTKIKMPILLSQKHPQSVAKAAIIFLIALFGMVLALQISAGQKVYAQELNDDQLQAATEANCTTGNTDEKSACRNGFRHGYRGDETLNEACVNRSTYNSAEKEACKKGYSDGKAKRASEGSSSSSGTSLAKKSKSTGGDVCGNSSKDTENVHTKFNFGCLGPDYDIARNGHLSPIMDVTYSIIRFLTAGVGVVIVISAIMAGIKYSSSEGNAEATQAAKDRIRATLIGLLVYVFAFSIIQYLVPGGVFK